MGFNDAFQKANGHIRMSGIEVMELWNQAKQVDGVIVEIGTLHGGSAVMLSDSKAKVYTIDVNPRLEVEGDFELIKGDSIEIAKTWKRPIDLLFIDGNHTYEGVRDDIASWLPFVRDGGVVIFHDYGSWAGVTEAVDEAVRAGLLEKSTKAESLLVTKKL